MTTEPKRVFVHPESDLARLLDEAVRQPLLLEKGGVTFRLSAEPPHTEAGYDPRVAVAAMRAEAGSWSDVDAEAFKAFLHQAREAGTKPEKPA